MRLFLGRNAFPLTVGAIAVAFLTLFFLLPLLKVFGASILDNAGMRFTLENYTSVLSNPFFLNGLTNSLTIAAAAAVCTVLAGVPFAFCLARLPIGGKAVLLALAALPLVLPSFVSAYALVLLFGRSGIVTGALQSLGIPFESLYGAKGIIAVYTLTLYPYVALPVIAAFKSVDVSVEEAAQNLGASRARVLRTVTLPLVLPSILSGGLLVFIEALENFGVPFVLAEDRPILSVEAYKLFVGETTDNPASAGVLGVVLVACTVIALLVQRAVLARRNFSTGTRRSATIMPVSPAMRRLGAAYCWTLVGLALVPFAAVVVISFMRFSGPVLQGSFALDNFAQLFARSYRPLTNTLLLATLAACGATLIGVPIGYIVVRHRSRLSGLIDIVATSPFAVAGTVLGIGLVMTYSGGFLVLTGTAAIMILAYMVRKLPFSVRSASAILHQIDPSLEEASINLGVPPALTFARITVPLMLGGIVGGLVLTFVTVASELSATVVLYSGQWSTMTIAMFQALEGTSAGIAAAAATVLIICTVLPVALVYRLLRRHELSMM
ncbi:MAG: iron ABC transporter permease [Alphaproteobacteria bacterium]|nr:iron ABC transporter permease [Alphaproteobacteria bacterium]